MSKVQKKPPELSKQAQKAIKLMNMKLRGRIKKGIDGIPAGDILPLQGEDDMYRLRIGKYRITFLWISDEQIFIQGILSRGEVYKGV